MLNCRYMDDAPLAGTPTATSRDRHVRGWTAGGFTLTELAVTLAVVTAISLGAATGLLSANRTGSVDRNRTSARALCQDRIEQALSQPFSPPNTIPSIFGTWPVPVADTITSSDTVDVYADDGGASVISGTRTVTVSRPNTTLNYVLVTARVNYLFRGSNYQQEICTVRAPD